MRLCALCACPGRAATAMGGPRSAAARRRGRARGGGAEGDWRPWDGASRTGTRPGRGTLAGEKGSRLSPAAGTRRLAFGDCVQRLWPRRGWWATQRREAVSGAREERTFFAPRLSGKSPRPKGAGSRTGATPYERYCAGWPGPNAAGRGSGSTGWGRTEEYSVRFRRRDSACWAVVDLVVAVVDGRGEEAAVRSSSLAPLRSLATQPPSPKTPGVPDGRWLRWRLGERAGLGDGTQQEPGVTPDRDKLAWRLEIWDH